MTNIKFPKTPFVNCVFNWRQSNSGQCTVWDKYDRCDPSRLKRYLYRLPEGLQVQVGDTVLVHCQTGYQLVEVVEVNALCNFDTNSVAPVVCPVNMEPYFEYVAQQQQLKVLRAELERKKKELEAQVTYDLLAEKSPEFNELLSAFRKLGGTI